MNSKFFKFIAAALILGIMIVVGLNLSSQVKAKDEFSKIFSSAFSHSKLLHIKNIPVPDENSQRQSTRNTIDLASGKKLIIPPLPGLVRVDGLYPEIDEMFIRGYPGNKTAKFHSTEKAWVESSKIIIQGRKLERLDENVWVSSAHTCGDKHKRPCDNVKDIVVGWRRIGPENRVTFGDVPDSEFWYSDGTDTKYLITKHLNIYGYTILDNQIIAMSFLLIPEELPVTKEWIAVQEKRVEDWVREIRKINNY